MTGQEHAAFMAKVRQRARRIDPAAFQTYWTYGSIMDPYCTGYGEEGVAGRVWWVYDDVGLVVTAWDFMDAHPRVGWDDIHAREDAQSRNGPDPLKGRL
jgi:hypothetical protein